MRLAIIVGSVRLGRLGPVVAAWVEQAAAARPEFDTVLVDLLEYDLPSTLATTEDSARFAGVVDSADAFVVVTPEYNHGVPGALKTALDSVKYEWRGKPVGFVSYGGIGGGVRAVEQLRVVAAELHMVSVRDAPSLHGVRSRRGDGPIAPDGTVHDGPATDALDRMLTQIQWWATNRGTAPYPK